MPRARGLAQGPSAARDLWRSQAASTASVDAMIAASPPGVLVDNFVHNLAPEGFKEEERQDAAGRLTASHRWALFVRSRIAADVAGVCVALRGAPCLGAALMLAGRSLCWLCGAAAARVDEEARPAPISPPLARIVGGTAAALAAAALLGALAPAGRGRALGRWAYALALTSLEVARLVADRVRGRTHLSF